jgi:hypothetical protein
MFYLLLGINLRCTCVWAQLGGAKDDYLISNHVMDLGMWNSVRQDFWGIIGRDPNVSKSNRLHVGHLPVLSL